MQRWGYNFNARRKERERKLKLKTSDSKREVKKTCLASSHIHLNDDEDNN